MRVLVLNEIIPYFVFQIIYSGRQLVGQMRDQNPDLFEAATAAAANSGLSDFNSDSANNGSDQAPPAP